MTTVVDRVQRYQALDPAQSFIVQAPAGSGKTELLIQRYLKLLPFVEYPEQILAMTFTRKAASEMKNRILKALERAGSDTPPEFPHERLTWELARKVLKQDRKRNWRLLDNPSRLRIQTIDSFCTGLTQQMPLLSGLGGPPGIEEKAGKLYQETARRTLQLVEAEGKTGDAVRTLLKHLDNSPADFLKKITDLLGKRDQWLMPFFQRLTLTEQSKSYLEQVLSGLVGSKLEQARDLLPPEAAGRLVGFAAYAAGNLMQDDPQHPVACLHGLQSLPAPEAACLDSWQGLATLLLTNDGEFRRQVDKRIGFPPQKKGETNPMKEDFQEFLLSLLLQEELKTALREITQLPHPWFGDDEWRLLQASLVLLAELEKILREVFAEHGKTDFTEISLSALKALGDADDPTDLLLKLDMKLQHILVDEYQDTSFKQYRLLEQLTSGWVPGDGRSLFIVGDPMQSIYRFRDAVVGLFLRARDEGIGDIHLQPLTLQANFRSCKEIVDWVNCCFAEIFPASDDPVLGAIQYTPSEAALPVNGGPGVVLHSVKDHKSGEEAASVVNLIREIRAAHKTDSIAVLVRARPHLNRIIPALQEAGIKFRAEDIHSLEERPAILDLLALMRSLLFPGDRLSWLSVLRAPWCGLSLDDLHRLCHDGGDAPLWAHLNDRERVARLSADGQVRLRRFVPVMEKTLQSRATANLRDLVEGCWIALGGPACVDETTLKDAAVFLNKITEVLEEGDFSRLYDFEKELENLYAAAEAGAADAVHIMTMHKAKGLEFDFVILPGLGKKPPSPSKTLLYWIPHGENLLIAPVQEKGGEKFAIYDFLASLDKEKERLETLRLLYVSATRAKKQLHLFGHTRSKKGERSPYATSLLGKLWPYLQRDWPHSLEQGGEPATKAQDTAANGPAIRRLPSGFQLPAAPPSLAAEDHAGQEFIWAGNQARCVGTVLHLVFKDLAGLEETAGKMDKPVLKTALLGQGLPHSQLESAVEDAMKAIDNILRDDNGRWILKNHGDHESELPLSGIIDGGCRNRIIDRTFVDENGVRWIIDFKTGEHQGTDLDGFFEEEKERYRAQLGEYEELIRQSGETRPIKKALYYPMHRRLIEF